MLIDVKNLFKIYHEGEESEVRALDGVSLSVDRGEFLAIIGQSGSGKSTLMNILGCLDIPTYGDYHLDGVDVTELSDRQLAHIRNKQIGFIFQGFNLIPALNAWENVELPLIYQGVPASKRADRVEAALERVGLAERAGHKPTEMSGGQQQRVGIARAFAAKPAVIFADEPTGNLDSVTTRQVLRMMLAMTKENGITFVMVTHENDLAACADRIVTIKDGRVLSNRLLTDAEKEENRKKLFGEMEQADVAEPQTTVRGDTGGIEEPHTTLPGRQKGRRPARAAKKQESAQPAQNTGGAQPAEKRGNNDETKE